jgi:hypothetical protein
MSICPSHRPAGRPVRQTSTAVRFVATRADPVPTGSRAAIGCSLSRHDSNMERYALTEQCWTDASCLPNERREDRAAVPGGHVVLRVILAQDAPAARAVMTSTTGFTKTRVGASIPCAVVGEVIAASSSGLSLGTIVMSWALGGVRRRSGGAEVPRRARPSPGAQPRPERPDGLLRGDTYRRTTTGQTVVVSAASGDVGHIAGQISRLAGRVPLASPVQTAKHQRLEADYKFTGTVIIARRRSSAICVRRATKPVCTCSQTTSADRFSTRCCP